MRLRDGDDRVGRLERRALGEARERIAAAELLALPRPHRLEAVHGRDVRNAVHELREVAAEVCVPGVAVHQIRPFGAGRHRQVDREGLQGRRVGPLAAERLPRAIRGDGGHRVGGPFGTPAMHGDVDPSRELARHVLGVHAGPAVHVRRVFAGEQRDFHAVTTSPLPITAMPFSEMEEALPVGHRIDADLRARLDPHVLVDDRIAHDRSAADVDIMHQHRALRPGHTSARAHRGRGSTAARCRPRRRRRRRPSSSSPCRHGPARRRRTSPAAAAPAR